MQTHGNPYRTVRPDHTVTRHHHDPRISDQNAQLGIEV
jgi:hypothetical protein